MIDVAMSCVGCIEVSFAMNCLIVSCVFLPEPVISSQTSAQLAKALSARDCKVTVIAPFPNRPGGRLYPGYKRRIIWRESSTDTYRTIRCFSTFSSQSKTLSRLLENISFGITSGIVALTMPKPSVVYSNTWPIFATSLLWLVSRLRGVPMVLSIQDMYPESLILQRRLRAGSKVARILRKIDSFVVRRCAAVIVISPAFASLYRNERRIAPERIHVVPNWIDSQAVEPNDPRAAAVRAQYGVPVEARLAVYGGNIGVAAGVETLIEACRYLENETGFRLLVAGEGSQLAMCQNMVLRASDHRIKFYTPWPKEDTSRVLGAADILILPTQGKQSLASVPSKLLTYMLSAKPVLALASPQSDLANIITQAGCGWVVEPDKPDLLADRIKHILALDAEELRQRGLAGREFTLARLTKEICLPRVVEIIEQAALN